VSLENQLLPGTVEFAIHVLVERRRDTAIFESRYKNEETGCPAYDPKLLLKVIVLAYARGIIVSCRIEQACRKNIPCMALACGQVPDHSTRAAFVASVTGESTSVFRDILLVCAEQDLWGGTHFALDGAKLPSNAAKEWSGTFADLRRKKEKVEERVQQVLAPHETAEKAGEAALAAGYRAEQDKRHQQGKRWERQATRIEAFLAAHEPNPSAGSGARSCRITSRIMTRRNCSLPRG
jgi:transposase